MRNVAIAPVENVGVDQGGFDIFVTEKFLDGADVVAVFEEVGGEGMTEGMAGDVFGDAGDSNPLFELSIGVGRFAIEDEG